MFTDSPPVQQIEIPAIRCAPATTETQSVLIDAGCSKACRGKGKDQRGSIRLHWNGTALHSRLLILVMKRAIKLHPVQRAGLLHGVCETESFHLHCGTSHLRRSKAARNIQAVVRER